MNRLGILAGSGDLPVLAAQEARRRQWQVVVVAVTGRPAADFSAVADRVYSLPFGRLQAALDSLQAEGVRDVLMLGKVEKAWLYQPGADMDAAGRQLLAAARDRRDDSLLGAAVQWLESQGLRVWGQAQLMPDLLAQSGCYTRRQPTRAEWADVAFGLRIARQIAGLDIGQTVVVCRQAVMAVEAIEGTDACILRGGSLAGGGAVVAKVAKPHQDLRFDMPTVGPQTIRSMVQAGARVLAMEAGRTLFLGRAEALALADQQGIAVVAVEGMESGGVVTAGEAGL